MVDFGPSGNEKFIFFRQNIGMFERLFTQTNDDNDHDHRHYHQDHHIHHHYQDFVHQDTWWSQCSPTESGANYPWNVSDSLNQSLVMMMLMLLPITPINVSSWHCWCCCWCWWWWLVLGDLCMKTLNLGLLEKEEKKTQHFWHLQIIWIVCPDKAHTASEKLRIVLTLVSAELCYPEKQTKELAVLCIGNLSSSSSSWSWSWSWSSSSPSSSS